MALSISPLLRASPYHVFAAGVCAIVAVAAVDLLWQQPQLALPLATHAVATFGVVFGLAAVLRRFTGKRQLLGTLAITAAILAAVAQPATTLGGWAAVAAAAALATTAKHWPLYKGAPLANPAALGMAAVALVLALFPAAPIYSASWWGAAFGHGWSLLLILPVGAYAAWRMRRWWVAVGALPALALVALVAGWGLGSLSFLVADSTLWYFLLIMLVDPKTSPAAPTMQLLYGAVAGAAYIGFSAMGIPAGALCAVVLANILALALKTPWGHRISSRLSFL